MFFFNERYKYRFMAGSLYLTLSLVARGGEMAETMARWILARSTRANLLQRKLARLEAAGAITILPGGPLDQRILRLTDGGRLRLLGGVNPEVEWGRRWDGVWRIVAFDIPESALALRTRLRRRLRDFRFGWLQKSVWISPHPVDAFHQVLGETGIAPESLSYFEAKPAGGESTAALVNGAWDFTRLLEDYTAYHEILRRRPEWPASTATDWFHWLEAEHQAWCRIARRDPFLPRELQPPDYPGQAAWAERCEALRAFAREMEPWARA
jgi:phenylacetic acid degradation operon negative regulatory protein